LLRGNVGGEAVGNEDDENDDLETVCDTGQVDPKSHRNSGRCRLGGKSSNLGEIDHVKEPFHD
jgi:hypothetical protein